MTNNESTLLFEETASFGVPRGLGVWRNPESGGTDRSEGGMFVFLSGRPYRYNSENLRGNVEFILENLFHEPRFRDDEDPFVNRINQNFPNPFFSTTGFDYYLSQSSEVSIDIY